MNLFILDENPQKAARYHVDRHVVKMPTETAQMISFIYHDTEFWDDKIPDFMMGFSKTHYKHPCSIWMRESLENFLYACQLGMELYKEYQFRYNQPEKHLRARQIFEFALQTPPKLPKLGLTPFAQAMDEQYIKFSCPIQNYREYYREGKKHLHSWKNRAIPPFLSVNNVLTNI
ncbi:hypothetical protein EBU94_06025 [bacterium]|nr:hypothetical protein [bacterium]